MKSGLCRVFFVIAVFQISAFSQSVNLPLDHWAYEFLEKMQVKGLINDFTALEKPLTREKIAEIIKTIDSKTGSRNSILTNSELALFEKLKGDFVDELMGSDVRVKKDLYEPHLYTWMEKSSRFHIDLNSSQEFNLNYKDTGGVNSNISKTTAGIILRGYLNTNLYFYLYFRNTLIRGSDITTSNFDPSKGLPVGVDEKNVFMDQALAYFVYRTPWFDLEVGRDEFVWGPGFRGGVTLSRNNPVIDMIKLSTQYSLFRFTSLIGFLQSSFRQKNIAAHKIEINPFPGVFIGGSEVVIYGERGTEFLYALPIMPYHIAEHHLGDRDNNSMAFDFTLDRIRNTRLYGELFIDDYSLTRNPFTYFGNKFAFLLGALFFEPFGVKDLSIRVEYVRVEPYVYSHYNPVNRYQNYDRVLGYWTGPDSDDLYLLFKYFLNYRAAFSASYSLTRRGESGIEEYKPTKGETKKFLNGVVQRTGSISFQFKYEILRDQYITFTIDHVSWNNYRHVSGNELSDFRFDLIYSMNY